MFNREYHTLMHVIASISICHTLLMSDIVTVELSALRWSDLVSSCFCRFWMTSLGAPDLWTHTFTHSQVRSSERYVMIRIHGCAAHLKSIFPPLVLFFVSILSFNCKLLWIMQQKKNTTDNEIYLWNTVCFVLTIGAHVKDLRLERQAFFVFVPFPFDSFWHLVKKYYRLVFATKCHSVHRLWWAAIFHLVFVVLWVDYGHFCFAFVSVDASVVYNLIIWS